VHLFNSTNLAQYSASGPSPIQGRLAYASVLQREDDKNILYIHGGFNVPPPATGDAPLISEDNLLNDIICCGMPTISNNSNLYC